MALTDGIVGCWSPSVRGSGYLLPDLVRGNHGTLTNMDAGTDWPGTAVRGVHGRVLDFDGTDDYVAITRNLFSGLAVVSVSFWGQPRTTTDRVEITQGTDSLNRCGFAFSEDGNAYVVPNFSGTATGFGFSAWSGFGVSSFLHGVFIYNAIGSTNADRGKIYLNGIRQTLSFVGTLPTTAISQAGTPFIGARPGPSSYSNGRIGEVAVWNRELTPAEIRDLHRSGNGAIGRQLTGQTRRRVYGFAPAGFRAYWARRNSQIIGGGV